MCREQRLDHQDTYAMEEESDEEQLSDDEEECWKLLFRHPLHRRSDDMVLESKTFEDVENGSITLDLYKAAVLTVKLTESLHEKLSRASPYVEATLVAKTQADVLEPLVDLATTRMAAGQAIMRLSWIKVAQTMRTNRTAATAPLFLRVQLLNGIAPYQVLHISKVSPEITFSNVSPISPGGIFFS